ncbi:hypothetical protein PI125_g15013 [Phytophthora idaei]|nr:hypothetical protein PI125_g15013 [Phytophthora idaei]
MTPLVANAFVPPSDHAGHSGRQTPSFVTTTATLPYHVFTQRRSSQRDCELKHLQAALVLLVQPASVAGSQA